MTEYESGLILLAGLYDSLAVQLERDRRCLSEGKSPGPAEPRQAGDLALRLTDADRRIASLADDWPGIRRRLPAPDQQRIEVLAARLRSQAQGLQQLARQNEQMLQRFRDSTRESLNEVRRGSQFLHNVLQQQERHPRFIDAHR